MQLEILAGFRIPFSDGFAFQNCHSRIITQKLSDLVLPKMVPREHNLVKWARPCLDRREKKMLQVHPRLEGCFSIKGAQKAVQLATLCLSRDAKARSLMSEVVEALVPLPNLKDMACSSSYFQAMNSEHAGAIIYTRRMQVGQPEDDDGAQ